jgi:phosphatidylserine/phosphatidylglycerophosphate/cardiolipin synthase-like enzyme
MGFTNWDPRSFRLNFEFNVEILAAQNIESRWHLLRRLPWLGNGRVNRTLRAPHRHMAAGTIGHKT